MKLFSLIIALLVLLFSQSCKKAEQNNSKQIYLQNQFPLIEKPFLELPTGAIQPEGWLKEMLIRQKTGVTGNLDQLYPAVMGSRNGWLGGDGDQWERGPYWLDGLVPLAYILNDPDLISKTKPWIEWALNSQQPDGYFGPVRDFPDEPGLQRNNSRDWWPKMVMLKVLKQYYSASGDERVIHLFLNYFRYQLKTLPEKPLGHWTFWSEYRAGDNLLNVLWLYNITGEKFLLELAELLHQQSFNFTDEFLHGGLLSGKGGIHCVNLAQGIKEPVVYYQYSGEKKHLDAVKKAFNDIKRFHGQPQGLFGGDEALHGMNPTQGSELCTAVEMMFSLETILQITGETTFADHIEKIAFNALPAQIAEDFLTRQYFQQPNQVMITRHMRNFDINHDATDLVFGLLTGYPCCTSNMHQGWPKFTQNLFYATPDRGLAALIYSPCKVKAMVADSQMTEIEEITNYPFDEKIVFKINLQDTALEVIFPFYLRIPDWCNSPEVKINGQSFNFPEDEKLLKIYRNWKSGDLVELALPMSINLTTWYENAKTVERGPLVYALKIGEKKVKITNTKDPELYGDHYFEILPETVWNYGLTSATVNNPEGSFQVKRNEISEYPWKAEHSPLEIRTKGIRIPSWKIYNEMAGPLPWSNMYNIELGENPVEEDIILIPYGCTKLRISEFPVILER